jgi:hypothetical protein
MDETDLIKCDPKDIESIYRRVVLSNPSVYPELYRIETGKNKLRFDSGSYDTQ